MRHRSQLIFIWKAGAVVEGRVLLSPAAAIKVTGYLWARTAAVNGARILRYEVIQRAPQEKYALTSSDWRRRRAV